MKSFDAIRLQIAAAASAFALSLVLIAGTVNVPADSTDANRTVIAANLA